MKSSWQHNNKEHNQIKALLFRTLVLTHRWLGIAIGWLMLMWCLSGLVMMYVAYPELSPRDRDAALQPLTPTHCCILPAELFSANEPIKSVELFMLNAQPLLHVTPAAGEDQLLNLNNGEPLPGITSRLAVQAARPFTTATASSIPSVALIERDQWTVYPRYNAHRPLYHVTLHDADGTEVYVSSRSGDVVQKTTRTQRFWNWLGAVPHWLYFTAIRAQPSLWNNLVITSSLAGCFLTGFGIYLGIRQLRRRRDGELHSPYRQWKYWHHLTGLVFGVLVLSWIFSGLMSMQPWGFLESKADTTAEQSLQGSLPTWSQIHTALVTLPTAALPTNTVRLAGNTMAGQLYFNAAQHTSGAVHIRRLNAQWQAAPLTLAEVERWASQLHPQARTELLTHEDAFYYSRISQPRALPVWRVVLPDATRYYFDAITGQLITRMDADARGFRWLHLGLHRLDFAAWMRISPWRDVFMWCLLLGVTAVCATGTVLGVKRLRWQRRHHRVS